MFLAMDSDPTQYVGTADVARAFGVSVKTVVMWINTGRLTAIQPAGENGRYRIPSTEIARLKGQPLADAGSARAVLLAVAALLGVLLAVGPGLVGAARLGLALAAAALVGVPLVITGAFVVDVVRDAADGVRARHRAGMARLRGAAGSAR